MPLSSSCSISFVPIFLSFLLVCLLHLHHLPSSCVSSISVSLPSSPLSSSIAISLFYTFFFLSPHLVCAPPSSFCSLFFLIELILITSSNLHNVPFSYRFFFSPSFPLFVVSRSLFLFSSYSGLGASSSDSSYSYSASFLAFTACVLLLWFCFSFFFLVSLLFIFFLDHLCLLLMLILLVTSPPFPFYPVILSHCIFLVLFFFCCIFSSSSFSLITFHSFTSSSSCSGSLLI